MKGKDERYPDYPLFKGLQRPLGFVAGLVVLVAVVSTGIALIMLKQRKGLHTKKDGRGVYIYAHSKKL